MARFILVHGAFHSGWCWERLGPVLDKMGHRVECVDLPGLDEAGASSPQNWLDVWAGAVADRVFADPEPAILVSHSRAGIIVSDAAERAFGNVLGVIHIAALVVPNGSSAAAVRQSLGEIARSPIELLPGDDGRSVRVDVQSVASAIYSGSDPGDLGNVLQRLQPEPVDGFAISPRLSEERFGQIPQVYLECLRDKAIPIDFQRAMQRLIQCQNVVTMDADHTPFWSAPDELARKLNKCLKYLTIK